MNKGTKLRTILRVFASLQNTAVVLTATNTGQYYPLRASSSGSSVSYRTYFCAKGRWK